MTSRKLAIAAIVLWLVTLAVFGVFFVRGNTTAGSDKRTAIVLGTGERELILNEMRGLLTSTHAILEGLNNGDRAQIARAASQAGMASAADVNPALMSKLPLEFKALGMSVHHDMDDLAAAASGGKPAVDIQKMLTSTLAKCVSCHSAWQLQAAD